MKELLGGKGAGLAEMNRLGIPVPPGFTITTEVCTYYYEHGAAIRPSSTREVRAAVAHVEKLVGGAKFGDAARSAARQRALGRARLDAGHDGHRPQPRPQRRHRRGAGQEVGLAALRLRLLSPLRADVRRRRARPQARVARTRPIRSRSLLEKQEGSARRPARHRARRARRCASWSPSSRPRSSSARGATSPTIRGSSCGARSAPCSAPGRTRAPSPTVRCTTSRRAGAPPSPCRRWSSATWATTAPPASPSRAIRRPASAASSASSCINAQGEDVVAGIRTPQPINDASKRQPDDKSLEELMPAAYAELVAHLRAAREALPRHAGHRVHHPAGQALDAADAHRQAHRQGDGAHRRRDGEGGDDHRRRGDPARRRRQARRAAAPDARSQGATKRIIARGLPASPGAAVGKVVFHADDAVADGAEGRAA